jgi:uncharacterized protein (TIGR03435 family)
MKGIGMLVVCLCVAALSRGQGSFEVASIKLHPGIITYSADPSVKGNRVTSTASTLLDLIESAYHVRRDQVSGLPRWAESDHYDLEAKAGADAITTEQMRTMLQALLADRCQLRVHREAKEVPTYEMVVGKNGAKFGESAADEQPTNRITGGATGSHMEVRKGTMAQLASRLSSNGAGRPVIDRTGLRGSYSFTLDWMQQVGAESELPSLFVALQEQLGLRLEPASGPSEIIVVDHVERPSAN